MEDAFKEFLFQFEKNKHDLTILRCAYIFGPSGCGKTRFVTHFLKKMGYDVVTYNAGDIRNKHIIDNINMSSSNVMSMFKRNKTSKIAIVMDEIECMNNGDKGGINALIKFIRPKKTKKQMNEEITQIPIVCIGNNHVDKKVAELMKCSCVIEMSKPTREYMLHILNEILPDMKSVYESIIQYAEGDLKKMVNMCNIVHKTGENIVDQFESRPLVEDAKECAKRIFLTSPALAYHANVHETDRTIVSMLWHENAADILSKIDTGRDALYKEIISNICYADYVDRVTFQKQVWQMNEMSSIVKTFYVNSLLSEKWTSKKRMNEVRFTKMLTKYSTEYNNYTFILKLCQILGMDKRDMFDHIAEERKTKSAEQISVDIDSDEITAVDINRMFRFLDKCSV